jgi:hypothetical protein
MRADQSEALSLQHLSALTATQEKYGLVVVEVAAKTVDSAPRLGPVSMQVSLVQALAVSM